ncbi:hypothetical protein [Lonepinella koalarum]|uniref:hypothetical protein n=1 Tax=Lonepinella koalarum TaxID=53417 RepID=UPI001403634E|nr:hypothetical protein [Lonepinella koalarum]
MINLNRVSPDGRPYFLLLATLALRAVGKANVQNSTNFVLVQKKVGKEKHTPTSPLIFA